MITAGVPWTASEPFCVDLWILKVCLCAKSTEISDGDLCCLRSPQRSVKPVRPQVGQWII